MTKKELFLGIFNAILIGIVITYGLIIILFATAIKQREKQLNQAIREKVEYKWMCAK